MENVLTSYHDNMNNTEGIQVASSERIIYTASDFARSTLLHLQEAGTLQAKYLHTSSRNNLASYLFFIVESGSGTLEYDNETYHLSQHDCVFIDCRKPYAHTTSNDFWKLKWVHFYGPNMVAVYDKYLERGGKPKFRTTQLQAYEDVLDEIYELAVSSVYVKDMKINEKLSGLLVFLMEDSWGTDMGEVNSGKIQDMHKIKEYLDLNYTKKISLDELSERFFINKFYLLELFKEHYGTTVNDYLIRMRITRGKRLLRFSDMTIDQISEECGMNSPNYFSRMFKKVEGTTPSEYKKLWRV